MTGERKALEAGLKALKAMKKFNVPRAAQVWEIPVHTPDILAASDAIDANIEGIWRREIKNGLRKQRDGHSEGYRSFTSGMSLNCHS